MSILVRSATLAKYSDVARGLGIDPERMVRQAGLDRQCLLVPDLRVPESSLTAVLEASAKASHCDNLGLLVGQTWRLSDFGVLSLLLQHQPTLRQTLAELKRYRHLMSDSVLIEVGEFSHLAVLELVLVTGGPHPGRQRMELALGALLSLCRFHLGAQWTPRRVHFTHAAPAQLQNHHRVFGPAIEFNAEFDGVVMDRTSLDVLNTASDPNMARYAQGFIDLQPRGETRRIADDVRRAVLALLPRGRSSIDQVSQSLGLNTRTLQRQLEQGGDSFQALLNEVRCELATQHLASGMHTVGHIAQLLGFAETSAFSRWFTQQFKVPPSRWKAE